MDPTEVQASLVQTLALLATQQQQMVELQTQFSQHVMNAQNRDGPPTGSNSSASVNAFKFVPLDESVESFIDFVDRLEAHFVLHNVPELSKVGCLIAALPPKLFKLLKNLIYPETHHSKTYEQLRKLLKDHLNLVPLVIPSRHALFTRRQLENESVTSYVTELQRLAADCKYQADVLAVVLRDVFVSGLRSKNILDRLFQEDDPTFAEVVQIALSIERAEGATHDVLASVKASAPTNATEGAAINRVQTKSEVVGQPSRSRRSATRRARAVNSPSTGTTPTGKTETEKNGKEEVCFACGEKGHKRPECKQTNLHCDFCNMDGHVDRVCFTKRKTKLSVKYIDDVDSPQDDFPYEEFALYQVDDTEKKIEDDKIFVWVSVEQLPIIFEMDCGSKRTVVNKATFDSIVPRAPLQTVSTVLVDYSNNILKPSGEVRVHVSDGKTTCEDLPLLVVEHRPNILGRDWLARLGWLSYDSLRFQRVQPGHQAEEIRQLSTAPSSVGVVALQAKYSQVFEPSVGKAVNRVCSLELKLSAQPVFRKARVVPFAVKQRVEEEIHNLVREGIWVPVVTSEWATPIVPVVKPVGICLCGDYSCTLNPALRVAQHPFPGFDEVFASLVGGQQFSTLDIKSAFLHLPVDEVLANLLTLNTHLGLFRPLWLMYRVSSAPALWQRYMDSLFVGTKCCVVHDDIIVTGATEEEHLARLEEVFKICAENGLHLNARKCKFFQEEVEFLGFKISQKGIHKTKHKIEAVLQMPRPTTVTEVKSFLGLVTFYGRFIPDLASLAQPLYVLTQKGRSFEWSAEHEKSFLRIKKEVASERVLMGYNPKLPLVLAVDASPVGLGAVLSHQMPNGDESPIAFASRTLTATEKRYAQIDKEALAIHWGIFKFYHYTFGVRFTLITDHQPLTHIFSSTKRLPQLSATRMLHYATELRLFNFDIRYRKSKLHGNADCLSRLPVTSEKLQEDRSSMYRLDSVVQYQLGCFQDLPITARQVAEATMRDPELSHLVEDLREGKNTKGKSMMYSLFGNVVFYGPRVFVPTALRPQVLQDLHEGHLGVAKMKSLARMAVYWPRIEAEIELVTQNCPHCVQSMKNPPKVAIHTWIPAERPWERIHIDFAEYKKQSLLIVVDAFAKWPEIFHTPNQLTDTVIDKLVALFAQFGIPRVIVSDNGPQFTSAEFQRFVQQHNIVHKTSVLFHPATNGQAEWYVGTVKAALRAMDLEEPKVSLEQKLRQFLFAFRRVPHITTGESPAKRFLGRELHSSLQWLRPERDKKSPPRSIATPNFQVGDRVAIRNYLYPNRRWLIGTVFAIDGPVSFTVDVNGTLFRRHADQMCRVGPSVSLSTQMEPVGGGTLIGSRRPEPPRILEKSSSPHPGPTAPPALPEPGATGGDPLPPSGLPAIPGTPTGPRRSNRD